MAARRSRLDGEFKLRKLLRTIHQTADNEVKVSMQHSADKVLATMKGLVPRSRLSEKYAHAVDHLQAFVSKSGLDAQIGLRGKTDNMRFFYMRFLEYGTKGYSGEIYRRADASKPGGQHTNNRNKANLKGRRNALLARDTKNKSNGTTFFGKYPDIPARPAHPWLRPALDVNREFIMADLKAALSRTLKRASEGA